MGLIVGFVAKAIMKQGGGLLSTLVIGVVGGAVGGWLGELVLGRSFGFIGSTLLAIGGACLVIWGWNALQRRS